MTNCQRWSPPPPNHPREVLCNHYATTMSRVYTLISMVRAIRFSGRMHVIPYYIFSKAYVVEPGLKSCSQCAYA